MNQEGLEVRVPSGWAVAGEVLTPNLEDPKERLVVASFPLRPGGVNCAHVPERALTDMSASDVLVAIHERLGVASFGTDAFAPRPCSFSFELGAEPESIECLDPSERDDIGIYRIISFTDAGRYFHAYLAIGSEATPDTRDHALTVLDSLVVEPSE